MPKMPSKKAGIIIAVIIAFVAKPALAADYTVDGKDSVIEFTAVQNGAPVKGNFADFSGDVKFSPQDLANSKAGITINLSGIETDYEEVAENLKGAEWFDVAKFATAKFVSSSFKKTGDKSFVADGFLTIRGISNPVALQFTLDEFSEKAAKATGSAVIRRSDFGVGQGEWKATDAVKDEVVINFTLNAKSK